MCEWKNVKGNERLLELNAKTVCSHQSRTLDARIHTRIHLEHRVKSYKLCLRHRHHPEHSHPSTWCTFCADIGRPDKWLCSQTAHGLQHGLLQTLRRSNSYYFRRTSYVCLLLVGWSDVVRLFANTYNDKHCAWLSGAGGKWVKCVCVCDHYVVLMNHIRSLY